VVIGWSVAGGLACALACGESERRGSGDGSSGGLSGSAGAVTTGGSSAAGSNGTGGSTMGGDGGAGGSSGSGGTAGDPAGGTATGGEAGATGGSSAGGEGGGGNCVDVCALHGAACCIPNVDCVSTETSCTVEVLAQKISTFSEQQVAALPQDLLLSFTDADIVWAATEPAPAARIELHMTPELAALHGEALEGADHSPFRVSCNGQLLFVGVVYMLQGAALFHLPVLHVALDEGEPLILRLGARQPAWLGLGGPVTLESRERLDRPELRAALCLRGPLRELEPL
jgi:hypothetical protein